LDALINAGGKGTRMGKCGVEKPMLTVGGKPTIQRVLEAVSASSHVDRVLVSVSDNTPGTERFLHRMGVETRLTTGEGFMEDIHMSFERLTSEFVLVSPSDLPLLNTSAVDALIEFFNPEMMESAMAVIDKETVCRAGVVPSYTMEDGGKEWVLSGISIMDRERTLRGEYLKEYCFQTDWFELAVNVNTQHELELARSYFRG
jgi:adenosylcobinamide-phosphate guanylyltransferase